MYPVPAPHTFGGMVGKGKHPILGVRSSDPVLSMVAPVGLAVAAGTALVVDLATTTRQAGRSLADLVADGPSLHELSPGRPGVALLPGGDVDRDAAIDVVYQLAGHWPAIVVRVSDPDFPFATVPVVPLFPGRFASVSLPARAVWQPVLGGGDPPGPGPVLPLLRPGVVRRILGGQMPRRSRWITAWGPVWQMPWA